MTSVPEVPRNIPFTNAATLRMFDTQFNQMRGKFEITQSGEILFHAEQAGTAMWIVDVAKVPALHFLDVTENGNRIINLAPHDTLQALTDDALWEKVLNGEIETHSA